MDSQYPIVETFHSLQGEGVWMGASAFFVRLGGCDVHCPFCDTKESWNADFHPIRSVEFLLTEIEAAKPAIVVITGGEPLLHDLNPLTKAIKNSGWRVHLETSGAHPFSGDFDWVTFSPKRFLLPHPEIYDRVHELKIIIQSSSDLDWAETEAAKVNDREVTLFLQPEWFTKSSTQLVIDYVRRHPQWRMSLQTHKYLGIS